MFSLQQTYEAKRQEFLVELQKREDEMRQMFVQRVKEKESELKEAERDVSRHTNTNSACCVLKMVYVLPYLVVVWKRKQ